MITKDEFINMFKLSGLNHGAGEYYIEQEQKIYSFTIGADGSIWNTTMGSRKNSADEIVKYRNNINYLGAIIITQ